MSTTTSTTMRAVVAHGPGDLRLDDLTVPQPGPGEVAVAVAYTGVCGSDLHYAQAGRNGAYEIREPLVLGHEVVGRVAATGPDVHDVPVGALAAVHPATPTPPRASREGRGMNLTVGGTYLGSASTWPHTQGAMVEVLITSAAQLRFLPSGLPLLRAVLAEPLAIALHGVDRAGPALSGADVLVCGAGPIGLLTIAALRARGAARITVTDIYPRPLQVARTLGADRTLQLGVEGQPERESYDVVVEAAGVLASTVTAIGAARRGGTVVQLGILPAGELGVPVSTIVSNELAYLGCQRFDVEMDEALELLAAHSELDAVITDVVDAEDASAAFATARDSARSSKVVIGFPQQR